MNDTIDIPAESVQTMAVATRQDELPVKADKAALTPAQARVESVADVLAKARAQASMLKLSPEEVKLLKAEFPDEAFKFGAGGDPNLIYIEHAFLRDRFDEALGMCQWALIRSRPHWAENYKTSSGKDAVRIYADCALIIRGCLVAEAIGEMTYFPNNAQQSYGDAAEGSETAAFRRCAKKIGVGLQAWKKDFGEGWRQRNRTGSRPAQPQTGASNPQPAPKPSPEPKSATTQAIAFNEAKFLKEAEVWLEKEGQAWVKANSSINAWVWAVANGHILQTEPLAAIRWQKLWDIDPADAAEMVRKHQMAEAGAKRKLQMALIERQDKIANEIGNVGIGDDEQRAFQAVYGAPGLGEQEEGPPPTIPVKEPASGGSVPTTCPKCQSTATKTSKDYDLVSFCEKCGNQWGEGGKPWEAHDWMTIPLPFASKDKQDYVGKTLGQISRIDSRYFFGITENCEYPAQPYNNRPPSAAKVAFAEACKKARDHRSKNKSGAVDAMRGVDTEPDWAHE